MTHSKLNSDREREKREETRETRDKRQETREKRGERERQTHPCTYTHAGIFVEHTLNLLIGLGRTDMTQN